MLVPSNQYSSLLLNGTFRMKGCRNKGLRSQHDGDARYELQSSVKVNNFGPSAVLVSAGSSLEALLVGCIFEILNFG
jgi:hypothetical protein